MYPWKPFDDVTDSRDVQHGTAAANDREIHRILVNDAAAVVH
jgi:hypothetical protein